MDVFRVSWCPLSERELVYQFKSLPVSSHLKATYLRFSSQLLPTVRKKADLELGIVLYKPMINECIMERERERERTWNKSDLDLDIVFTCLWSTKASQREGERESERGHGIKLIWSQMLFFHMPCDQGIHPKERGHGIKLIWSQMLFLFLPLFLFCFILLLLLLLLFFISFYLFIY